MKYSDSIATVSPSGQVEEDEMGTNGEKRMESQRERDH
jgi:hypothetical protein